MIGRLALGGLMFLACAAPAAAQARRTTPARSPVFVTINAGAQAPTARVDDAFDAPLYTENEHVTVDYPTRAATLVSASAGYRAWRRLVVGLGVSHASGSGDARIAADLPHPFFDNAFRHVDGTVRAGRSETAGHLTLGWLVPVTRRVRVLVGGGPSVVKVAQTLVTDMNFSEAYPYDTAVFTGARTSSGAGTAAGFHVAGDVTWMWSRRTGAGAQLQVTRARVKADAGDRALSFQAGGVQVGVGLRYQF